MPLYDTRCTFGRLDHTNNMTKANLPVSTGDPAEIDITGDITAEVSIRINGTAHAVLSTTVAAAKVLLDAGTHEILDSGRYYFPIINSTNKLYLRSASTAVVDGISYHFVEATG